MYNDLAFGPGLVFRQPLPHGIGTVAAPCRCCQSSGIATLDNLKGKIVDIGNPTTARRGAIDRLLQALDLPDDHIGKVRTLSGSAVISKICSGRIDATIVVFGHPNSAIRETTEICDLALIPIAGPRIDALLASNPDFSRYVIPAAT